ncbi:TRP1 [Candida oxycetoniae]|uniref:N-(5'-phosphoribosyl)anthranilate isomerase n=1 Tax=Candida oxycetoniae TaxID=497107 RepID=A0AAI9SX07_9ASCO|nr:TRP1 [Candida oxycetoniae]KAI3404669.1 TRP1 [Candida oxycetoniae]
MRLIKICGIQSIDAAETAVINGADLLGCILVPKRSRTVTPDLAKRISQLVRHKRSKTIEQILEGIAKRDFASSTVLDYFAFLQHEILQNGPFLVGVFRNQPFDEVLHVAKELNLDFIQLHGDENKLEFIKAGKEHGFGVIPRYVIPQQVEKLKSDSEEIMKLGSLSIPLLDSDQGGEGKVIDWEYINVNLGFTRCILAGGLNPENLAQTEQVNNVIGYDVSGGVETNGEKDMVKIAQFIARGKAI